MGRGHTLSNDLRIALVCMGKKLPLDAVSNYSGILVRTIRRLFSDYRKNGHALHRKHDIEMRGSQPKLTFDNISVRRNDYHSVYTNSA